MITLSIGSLQVGWGQNWGFANYSGLFQPSDVGDVDYHYVELDGSPVIERKEAFSRKLGNMVDRLELLGTTLQSAREEFERVWDFSGSSQHELSFESFADALKGMDVSPSSPEHTRKHDLKKIFCHELSKQLGLDEEADLLFYASEVIENYSAESVLRILALNPRNLDEPVIWRFADIVEDGFAERSEIVRPHSSPILLVTEGSSDAKILAKAFNLLRPNVADFFTFIDMEEGYPFTGTGNLHKFCQGLVKIHIQNRVLIIYDNDAEGSAKFALTSALPLPSNMRVMRLPDLSSLRDVATVGPSGISHGDINGRAASIECYLDMIWDNSETPTVRWTSYNSQSDRYQGELVYKESYTRQFLSLRRREPGYDFSKIEVVLKTVEDECKGLEPEG